jgi:hypothetical protein
MDWSGLSAKIRIPELSDDDKAYVEKIKRLIYKKICIKVESGVSDIKKGRIPFLQLSYNETDTGPSVKLIKFIINNALLIKREINAALKVGKLCIKNDLQIETNDYSLIKKHVVTLILKLE